MPDIVVGTATKLLTVAANATTVTVSGTLLANEGVLPYDVLIAGTGVAVIATTTGTGATLFTPWTGGALTNTQNWQVLLLSPLRSPSLYTARSIVEMQAFVSQFLALANPINVISTSNTPPGSPSDQEIYRAGTAPTGAWASQANTIQRWDASVSRWIPTSPTSRMICFDRNAASLTFWNGTAWTSALFDQVAGDARYARLAAGNTFTVNQSISTTFPQLVLNKTNASDTSSVTFQTGGSLRWTAGITGTNDYALARFPAGTFVDIPISVSLSTGITNFLQTPTVAGTTLPRRDTANTFLAAQTIQASSPFLAIDKNAIGDEASVLLRDRTTLRWSLALQATNNNLYIGRFNTLGAFVESSISINQSTGEITVARGILLATDSVGNLGSGSARFGTLFAVNGAINTSELAEKQDILEITDDMLDKWGKVRAKSFRWKASVAEKRDDARRHVGYIAQDVYEAFGEDGFRYGFLCRDAITVKRQKMVEQDGFEVLEETNEPLLDADGRQVYRMGLRYDQCAVIAAAWAERELARLSARVAALESA